MPKFQNTRLRETLAEIADMEKTGNMQLGNHAISDQMRALVTALSNAEKSTLNDALKRGAYVNQGPGVTTWGQQRTIKNELKSNEEKERALHRALLMVLALKSTQPFNTAVQDASNVVNGMRNAVGTAGSTGRLSEMTNRLRQELHDLDAALNMVRLQVNEVTFGGWDRTKHRNPLRPGCAIGQRGTNGPGTLGCFVTNPAGHIFLLSNLHVLKQAGIGAGDAEIIQPAHLTGGSYTDVVADYVDGDPALDAAIARVRPGLQVTQTIAGPNGFTISGTAAPYQWQLVKKRGCATGYRCGEVSDAQERSVAMLRPGFGNVDHLIQITRDGDRDEVDDLGFQLPGDSGTILCDVQGRVIGLMSLGGGNRQQTGLAIAIAPILQRFNVQILGTGLHIAP
jgi:hypothetical protein